MWRCVTSDACRLENPWPGAILARRIPCCRAYKAEGKGPCTPVGSVQEGCTVGCAVCCWATAVLAGAALTQRSTAHPDRAVARCVCKGWVQYVCSIAEGICGAADSPLCRMVPRARMATKLWCDLASFAAAAFCPTSPACTSAIVHASSPTRAHSTSGVASHRRRYPRGPNCGRCVRCDVPQLCRKRLRGVTVSCGSQTLKLRSVSSSASMMGAVSRRPA